MSENESKFIPEEIISKEQAKNDDVENPEISQMFKEVQEATPEVKWETNIPKEQYGVIIELPHSCFISATLTYKSEKEANLYIDMFSVNDKLQGKGIGSRLLKSLIVEATEYGATSLSGHITAHGALKAQAKVCGEDNLKFFKRFSDEQLNLTLNEVMAEEKVDYIVVSDLSKLNVSGLEKPSLNKNNS